MRRLFLAVALLVTIGAPQAFAVSVPLDDFSKVQTLTILIPPDPAAPTSKTDTTLTDGSFLGDSRTLNLYFSTATTPADFVSGSVTGAPAYKFSYSSNDGDTGYAELIYNSAAGLDLSSYSDFTFLLYADLSTTNGFSITLNDGVNSFTQSANLTGGSTLTTTFLLSGFTGVILNSVNSIKLTIDGRNVAALDGNAANPPAETTPEPYTLTMLGLGAILLGRRLSKRS